jgi:UDP-N-acetylglucosamine 2-epimerase
MIHIFIGTKAQLIKMAPVIQELDRRAIRYNLIDGGQHAALVSELIGQFGLRRPDISLGKEETNVDSITKALNWTGTHLSSALLDAGGVREKVFRGQNGICLIHGDTLTTLLSLIMAKRCGLKVAHVEAGLRSFHLLDPFPEEIIRLIAMRYSDLLFAPSDWAFDNLSRMNYGPKTVHAGGNTIIDTLRYARTKAGAERPLPGPYAVVTIHRVETIFSRARMERVALLIERMARDRKVLFVLHEPTRQRLTRYGFLERLKNVPGVEMRELQPYLAFVNLLARADFIVTDGGSIQEESHYLNVPCLIMRAKTERMEGLGKNAHLAGFNEERINRFFEMLPDLRRKNPDAQDSHPSGIIVDHVAAYA